MKYIYTLRVKYFYGQTVTMDELDNYNDYFRRQLGEVGSRYNKNPNWKAIAESKRAEIRVRKRLQEKNIDSGLHDKNWLIADYKNPFMDAYNTFINTLNQFIDLFHVAKDYACINIYNPLFDSCEYTNFSNFVVITLLILTLILIFLIVLIIVLVIISWFKKYKDNEKLVTFMLSIHYSYTTYVFFKRAIKLITII